MNEFKNFLPSNELSTLNIFVTNFTSLQIKSKNLPYFCNHLRQKQKNISDNSHSFTPLKPSTDFSIRMIKQRGRLSCMHMYINLAFESDECLSSMVLISMMCE